MLLTTKGIVLRTVKYGETSLIASVFTEALGLHSYMLKGIRSEQNKTKRAGLLQVASLLELSVDHKPNRQLQHIKEFQPAHIYQSLQEEIVKNSVAVYSVELLSRLLPQAETMGDLFQFVYGYYIAIDRAASATIANYPIYFTIQCGKYFGYNVLGNYSGSSPYLNAKEGIFTNMPPSIGVQLLDEDVKAIAELLSIENTAQMHQIRLNAASRNRILDWYIEFLQHHTQHLSNMRSLEILRAILH
jgi:DNA repair protein RecO (recombination protein O)